MINLAFCLRDVIPDDALVAVGFRALFKNGQVDILADRIGRYKKGEEYRWDYQTLVNWVDDKALPRLKARVRSTRSDSLEVFAFDEEGPPYLLPRAVAKVVGTDLAGTTFHLAASPNGSHGYLYVSAWLALACPGLPWPDLI